MEKIDKTTKSKDLFLKIIKIREFGVLIALILLIIVFSLTADSFTKPENFLNILRQISLLGIMSMGMTMVLVSGEIDLSVGSIYAFSAIISGLLMTNGVSIWVSIIIGLIGGISIGILNGVLVTYAKIPALIVTLGMSSVARGIALIISKAQIIPIKEYTVSDPTLNAFIFMGQGRIFGEIPMMIFFLLGITVISYIVFGKSMLGFRMRAVGGNPDAATASGINVKYIKIIAFGICGFTAALAGILNVAFLSNVQGTVGRGVELDVIAAVIVGGTALSGGKGTIIGTLIGVLILGVLRNGIIMLDVSPFYQVLIVGIVIIVAVGIDRLTTNDNL